MSTIVYKRAKTNQELHEILELQRANIPSVISEDEKHKEGFVTVHHTFEILKAMNDKCAHIIAKNNDQVVGYALCMLKEFKEGIEVLKSMFQKIDVSLKEGETYIVMGQICIAKTFRKQGVFRGLYSFMKEQLQSEFNMIITEVDFTNKRSLNAHYAVGFKLLHSYNSEGQDWALISWSWNQ